MNKTKGTTPKALQLKEINGIGESFRVLYYGKASSVPFIWESQPGTPKHPLSESSIHPPLTPPPSYNQFSQKYNNNSSKKSSLGLLRTVFLDNSSSTKTSSFSSSNSLSSSSSSSSMYLHSAPATPVRRKMSPVKFGLEDDYVIKRSCRIKKFKKAMLSFVKCGKA